MSKFDRDIKNLIQILVRNKVPAIYPGEIAQLLHCDAAIVEDVLLQMVAEEELEQAYELHCGECGEVMEVFEHTNLLGSASFPCSACYTQMESIAMNKMVNAFYPHGNGRIFSSN